jgi:hypothetical protein
MPNSEFERGHEAGELKMADDEVYGPIRQQICDEYVAAGGPKPRENWLYHATRRSTHGRDPCAEATANAVQG